MASEPKQPEIIDVPLTVEVVDGEIVLDGALPIAVSLTRDAALETGIDLVNTALQLDYSPLTKAKKH